MGAANEPDTGTLQHVIICLRKEDSLRAQHEKAACVAGAQRTDAKARCSQASNVAASSNLKGHDATRSLGFWVSGAPREAAFVRARVFT